MHPPHDPEATYAGLLSALLDARHDAATARFDSVLAGAEAQGLVPAALARELRYWQRAATAAVGDHLAATLPAALASLDAAARQAQADVEHGQLAWQGGRPLPPREVVDVTRSGDRPSRTGADRSADAHSAAGAQGDEASPAAADAQVAAPSDLLEHRRRALVAGLLAGSRTD